MADNDMTAESAGTSRRTMLKGAVGLGVGLAAWSAPKIGSVPAYALTNSTGIFDNVCYYLVWNISSARWGRGEVNVNNANATVGRLSGYGDSITGTTTATITWNNVFGTGNPLIIEAAGNPQTGSATITLIDDGPDNCDFEQITAVTYSDQPAFPPGSGTTSSCVDTLTANSDGGTVSLMSKAGTVTVPAAPADSRYYVVFNILC